MKKYILFIICLILTFSSSVFVLEEKEFVTVYVDGEEVAFPDERPYVNEDERTMVPIRFVSELLGAKVNWNQEWEYAKIIKGDDEIVIAIGTKTIIKNGDYYTMDTEAELIGERTMVPLRFISEHLGAKVSWAEKTESVYIETFPEEPLTEMVTSQ